MTPRNSSFSGSNSGETGQAPGGRTSSSQEDLLRQLDARYRGPLMKYFLKRADNPAEAEDLTQETFTRMVRCDDPAGISNLDSYIFSVAANLLRDQARRRKARGGVHLSVEDLVSEADPTLAPSTLVEELTPDRVLLGREALSAILQALAELEHRTRDIFVLYRLEGMKQRNIAEMFGISVSAVEKHVIKALAYLAARKRI